MNYFALSIGVLYLCAAIGALYSVKTAFAGLYLMYGISSFTVAYLEHSK